MKILSQEVVWRDEEDGDETMRLIIDANNEDEIRDQLSYRCGCTHDCCGHIQRYVSIVESAGRRHIVKVAMRRNI